MTNLKDIEQAGYTAPVVVTDEMVNVCISKLHEGVATSYSDLVKQALTAALSSALSSEAVRREAGFRDGVAAAVRYHDEEAEYYSTRHGDKDGVPFPIVAGWHRLFAQRILALRPTQPEPISVTASSGCVFDDIGVDKPGPAVKVDGWQPTHRHVKRGLEYQRMGIAEVQCSGSLTDYEVVVVYKDRDGRMWVHPKAEFEDGRFELLSRIGGAE